MYLATLIGVSFLFLNSDSPDRPLPQLEPAPHHSLLGEPSYFDILFHRPRYRPAFSLLILIFVLDPFKQRSGSL
jgi:hypothetical protein